MEEKIDELHERRCSKRKKERDSECTIHTWSTFSIWHLCRALIVSYRKSVASGVLSNLLPISCREPNECKKVKTRPNTKPAWCPFNWSVQLLLSLSLSLSLPLSS